MFIDEHRDRFGVEPICRTLDVSASAYYQRATGERSARVVEDERLIERIRAIHRANYECYGYRRMHAALARAGEIAGRDQVTRLMRQAGVQGATKPINPVSAKARAVHSADVKHGMLPGPAEPVPPQAWETIERDGRALCHQLRDELADQWRVGWVSFEHPSDPAPMSQRSLRRAKGAGFDRVSSR
jgi:transposase InsO family protein